MENDNSKNKNNISFIPGTIKPEVDYEEMNRLGKKLGIPVPQMYVKLETSYPDGTPGQVYESRSRTFNRNFWNIALGVMAESSAGTATFGAGFLALKDTGGTIRTMNYAVGGSSGYGVHSFNWVGAATAGVTTAGIVVGAGVTAESFEGFALSNKLAHGTTAGTISYNASAGHTATYDAPTKTWTGTCPRIFNNNSGGTLSITETGIYCNNQSAGTYTMTSRDLLGTAISLLNSGQLTVTYTLTLVYPA